MNAIVNMERQRLREAEPRRELDDDQMLEAVETLMRICPRYKKAVEELITELLVTRGENLAVTMGIDFPPDDLGDDEIRSVVRPPAPGPHAINNAAQAAMLVESDREQS